MKDTKGVRQVLAILGLEYHRAMPSAVGGQKAVRKAEATLQEIMLGMLPEERSVPKYAPYDRIARAYNKALTDMEQNIRGGFNNG